MLYHLHLVALFLVREHLRNHPIVYPQLDLPCVLKIHSLVLASPMEIGQLDLLCSLKTLLLVLASLRGISRSVVLYFLSSFMCLSHTSLSWSSLLICPGYPDWVDSFQSLQSFITVYQVIIIILSTNLHSFSLWSIIPLLCLCPSKPHSFCLLGLLIYL